MAKYSIDSSTLTDIADAIRTQYGEDTPIAVTDMAEAILGIEGGGGGGGESKVDMFEVMAMESQDSIDFPANPYDYEAILIYPTQTVPQNATVYYQMALFFPHHLKTSAGNYIVAFHGRSTWGSNISQGSYAKNTTSGTQSFEDLCVYDESTQSYKLSPRPADSYYFAKSIPYAIYAIKKEN